MRLSCWICAALAGLLAAVTFASAEETRPGKKEPITPGEVIPLFNGKDMTGLYTWLKDTKYEDPRRVFTVHDGMIRVSGDGYGYIVTKDEYRDYRLVVEYRWGTRTWGGRAKAAKDSGILVNCVGPDGNSGAWMASIECQIIEGGTGDFIVVNGKDADGKPIPVSLTCEVEFRKDGKRTANVWKKGGQRKVFKGGRIDWFGRDPEWKDVLGFRGRNDVESPDVEGEKGWTRVEVICDGGRITNIVNGTVVNEGFDASPPAGKILLQTEGAEIYFRKFELHPLKK